MEKIRRIHPEIRKGLRYKLVQKLMDEQMQNWLSQESTMKLVKKLISECKQKSANVVKNNILKKLFL